MQDSVPFVSIVSRVSAAFDRVVASTFILFLEDRMPCCTSHPVARNYCPAAGRPYVRNAIRPFVSRPYARIPIRSFAERPYTRTQWPHADRFCANAPGTGGAESASFPNIRPAGRAMSQRGTTTMAADCGLGSGRLPNVQSYKRAVNMRGAALCISFVRNSQPKTRCHRKSY